MEFAVKYFLLCVIGALGLASCQAERSSGEIVVAPPSIEAVEPTRLDPSSRDDGETICGGVAPVYGEYPPFPQPTYDRTLSAEYKYEIDRSVYDYSPKLAKWVVQFIQQRMNLFETQIADTSVSERTAYWKVTASTPVLANVEYRNVTLSDRYPNGATVWYTYLYNRASETRHEIDDLFIDRVIAEAALKEILVEEAVKLRAEKLDVTLPNYSLKADTIRQLPDEIFGNMDVELVQGQTTDSFSGLKISIRDTPPWNWFPEGGYDITIEGNRFQPLLKSRCKDLFP